MECLACLVSSHLQKLLDQALGSSEYDTRDNLVRHAQKRRVRAVHSVADVARRKLCRHRLLRGNWNGLILLGEEETDLNTVVPRLVLVVIREDTCRLRLEGCDGLFN